MTIRITVRVRGPGALAWGIRHRAPVLNAAGTMEVEATIMVEEQPPPLNGPVAIQWALARLEERLADYDLLMAGARTTRVDVETTLT